jgi:hypothetical protein
MPPINMLRVFRLFCLLRRGGQKTQDFKQNLSSGIQPANQNMLPARLVTRMRVIEGSFEAKLQTIKEPKGRRNAEGGLINTYRRIKLNNLES